MKIYLLITCLLVSYALSAQHDTTQKIMSGRKNSLEQQKKPYVILVSADGFRYDYAERYHAKNLLSLSSTGIRAESMIPSFPTLTFPNHYSIATGLYPSHNGLVDNTYYDNQRKDMYSMSNRKAVADGNRYGGTPLWVLAEQQQMLTANFYWVGSEADVKGIFSTYYYKYNEDLSIDRRIQIVVDWLSLPADVRPHLVTFYFPEVDHAGHIYGPEAPQTDASVHWVDAAMLKMSEAVKATGLPVNFIFVSDHGMTNVDTAHPIDITAAIDTSRFIYNRGAQLLQLYAKNKKEIKPAYKMMNKQQDGYTVYLKKNMPKHLHYRSKDDQFNNIGDILLIPVWPRVFTYPGRKPSPGAHGFDPLFIKDMHATFLAWGPAFKNNLHIPAFENVHIYPVITKILGLAYEEKIDGNKKLAEAILK